jgi:acyl-CoA synthetase (AMP-forming)/AMP-acid ligase II
VLSLPPAPAHPSLPLAAGLSAHGARVALLTGDEVLTYADLADRVEAAAARLGGGRRLILLAGANEVEPLVWYLAALAAGHPVLLVPGDHPDHVDALVAAYDPDLVITPRRGSWSVDERRSGSAHDLHPELALLLSTSGSTGSAKLVRLSYDNVQTNAEAIAEYLDLRPTDRAATTLPLHYCYGLSVVHSHLAVGAGIILTDLSVVDPCFWDAFERHGGTSFAGVPHTFELLDRIGFGSRSIPTLRAVTQAGGRLAPSTVRRFAELGRREGWDLVVMYGQTEATARMAFLPPGQALVHPDAVGVPIPGGAFEIEPVEGVEEGAGELVYRGPNVMLGYAEGPADLAVGRTVGALRTGDIARRTPDGLYQIVGRRSRFVKLFGLRVDLGQVEAVLAEAGVTACCTGDDAELVVGVGPGPDDEVVHDLVRSHVGLPAASVRVCRFDELPRLPNGKPDQVAVGERAQLDRSAVPPPPAGARGSVGDVFAEVLGRRDVADESTFVSLGGDSLSYVEASIRLEAVLGTLPPGWHTTPVADLESMRGTPARATRRLETNVVLRAVAIVLVVGTHAELFSLRGGAHVLLGIAGFNFARFQLGALRARDRLGPMVASVARIAVPAMIWIGLLVALTDDYSVANVFLLNDHLGDPEFDERWRYWFVEALVQMLLLFAALFALPAVRRVERRHAFGFALAVALAGLALRVHLVEGLDLRHHTVKPQSILWLFALGWVAARATSVLQRSVVSLLVLAAVPGFFYADGLREGMIAGGLLLLVWVPTLVVPRPLDRLIGPVAAASLSIYLTHWHVYPLLTERASPLAAVVASVVVGIVVAGLVARSTEWLSALDGRRRAGRATSPAGGTSQEVPVPRARRRARRPHLVAARQHLALDRPVGTVVGSASPRRLTPRLRR